MYRASETLPPFFERLEQRWLIFFHADDVVVAAVKNRFRCAFLTMKSIKREDTVFQIQLFEKLLNERNLVAFCVDFSLSDHLFFRMEKEGHETREMLIRRTRALQRPTNRFTINADPASQRMFTVEFCP